MNVDGPQTLIEAVKHYADLQVCHAYMVKLKWPDGVIRCPQCSGDQVGYIVSRCKFQCKAKGCRAQFSVKTGTIFEDSPLGLDKWFIAIWCVINAKNGVSSYEIHRAIGVTQKTAWFMDHRIRLAMKTGTFQKFHDVVESDETFIGGKAENMHAEKRERVIQGRGAVGKTAVHGVLQRGGQNQRESESGQGDGYPELGTGHVDERVASERRTQRGRLHRFERELREHRRAIHPSIRQSLGRIRSRARSHERTGKLLVVAQTVHSRHLRPRRAVPPGSLPRRRVLAVQLPPFDGWRAIQCGHERRSRQTDHLPIAVCNRRCRVYGDRIMAKKSTEATAFDKAMAALVQVPKTELDEALRKEQVAKKRRKKRKPKR